MITNYDIIIIGAGVAGLYAAHLLPSTSSVLILEKNTHIGGRAGNEMFYGTKVTIGAGVGRKNKDRLLTKLCDDLGIKYGTYKVNIEYSSTLYNYVDILDTIKYLRKKYRKHHRKLTFREFGIQILGIDKYHDFVVSSGYSDYEKADVYETLYHYGMDDNKSGWEMMSISWNELTDKMSIGQKIQTSTEVLSITYTDDYRNFMIQTNKKQYLANKVIIATTIDTVRRLLPYHDVYNHIHGQTFLRVYAKFDKKSAEILKRYVQSYTIVPGPLQKIIPMNPDKGVYMIGYSDNLYADRLRNKTSTLFEELVAISLGISEPLHILGIKEYYWPIGTHYYSALPEKYKSHSEFVYDAQHPVPNIYVVGEAVSSVNQGWVEGALESVKSILST